jgi:hypothetical protein
MLRPFCQSTPEVYLHRVFSIFDSSITGLLDASLFEGPLQIFTDIVRETFITRHCKLTPNEFRYEDPVCNGTPFSVAIRKHMQNINPCSFSRWRPSPMSHGLFGSAGWTNAVKILRYDDSKGFIKNTTPSKSLLKDRLYLFELVIDPECTRE